MLKSIPVSSQRLTWFQSYVDLRERRQLLAESSSTSLISIIASFAAQRRKPRLDWTQVFHESIIGFFLRGPLTFFWHDILHRIVADVLPNRRPILRAIFMMVIDQILFAPVD